MMSEGFDRTSEFRTCVQLFHQRVSSGRLQLKYRVNPQIQTFTQQIRAITSDFFHDCHGMSQDLKCTRVKLIKLSILLQNPHSPSTNLNKLIDVIQHDIIDLNKTKTELNNCLSRINAASLLNSQYIKHIRLIIVGLEYHLSNLVSNFRNLLDNNKHLLSSKSEDGNETRVQKQNKITNNRETTQSQWEQNQKPSFYVDSSVDQQPLPTIDHTHSNPSSCQLITRNSNPLLYPPIQNGVLPVPPRSDSREHVFPVSKNRIQPVDLYKPHLPLENPAPSHDQVQLFAKPIQTAFVDQEIRQRDAAIRRVESTIVQLGEIYEQFSTLVREQGDMVTRIDSNIDDAELNIDAAHTEFLSLMRRISGNRGFMIKVFTTLILCFLFVAWYSR